MKKGILLTTLGLASMSTQMFGGIVIDFSSPGVGGGTITDNTNTGTVSSTNVAIAGMLVEGDGTYDGFYAITGGVLAFSFTGNPSTSGNSLSITGTVGGCTAIPSEPLSCTTPLKNAVTAAALMTGSGSDTFSYTTTAGALDIDVSGADTKGSTLLSALNISSGVSWVMGGDTIGGNLATNVGGVATYNATSTDIGNNSVPEPTSILLLGTVLFGVTRLIRRRIA